MSRRTLRDFIFESNRIEGIVRAAKRSEIDAHERLLSRPALTVADVVEFVHAICQAPLRNAVGMNVYVGNHVPPRGGQHVVDELGALLASVNRNDLTPYEAHCRYETLHPFIDGNGRSGRAIWLWHMHLRGEGDEAVLLGFLHAFYYQTLQAHPARQP